MEYSFYLFATGKKRLGKTILHLYESGVVTGGCYQYTATLNLHFTGMVTIQIQLNCLYKVSHLFKSSERSFMFIVHVYLIVVNHY